MTRRWDFISVHAETFGIQRICRVLEVSRSGYYRWRDGAKARAARAAADEALTAEIREIHTAHKGTYGVRRVHAELRGFGHTVNRKRGERLMREDGIGGASPAASQAHHGPRPAGAARPGPGEPTVYRREAGREVVR